MNETISLTKKTLSEGSSVNVSSGSVFDVARLYATTKKYLPANSPANSVYYTTDTGELFYGTGTTGGVKRISDIVIIKDGASLPATGLDHKLYIVIEDESISFAVWDGEKFISAVTGASGGGGGITEDELDGKLATIFNNMSTELTNSLTTVINGVVDKAFAKSKTQVDTFYVGEEEIETEFILSQEPISDIHLYVNGMRYFDNNFTYDKDTKTLTWTYTEENGGFDIQDMEVAVEYDCLVSEG